MEVPMVTVKVGLNDINGIGHISFVDLPVDMGDSGRVCHPIYIDTRKGPFKFSYHNPKTGNSIYRQEKTNG